MTSPRPPRRRGSAPYGSRLLGPADQSPRATRVRVQLLLTAMLLLTNIIGAGLVFVISALVVPAPAPSSATVISLAIGVPVYVAVAVAIGASVGTVASLRALRWATTGGDTEPDPASQERTLRVPFRLTVLQFGLWMGATVLFTVLALLLQPERALTTGLTVGTAAVVVSGIAYLLADFALRPIAARALAASDLTARPRVAGLRVKAVIFWMLGTAAPVLSLLVAAVVSLTDPAASATRLAIVVIVVTVVVLVIGLFVTLLHAGSVADPVLSVRDAMLDVERGDLDASVVVYDGTELGLLQVGFNRMADGLRERERISDLFGRHVGREVAAQAASAAGDIELGGETRTVSVLFVDLVGSTTYATQHPPEDVVAVLNRFFAVIVEEVDTHGGLVNKFMGDAVLALFGAPVDLDDHATPALASARAIARRLADEVPELGAGIGVATGDVVVGNVGHETRFEYTVIGDAVNSAARLTDLAKDTDAGVLTTEQSVSAAQEDERAHWTASGETVLRGREEPTPLATLG